MNKEKILSIKEATIFHHYKTILNDVNLNLNKGEFIYIIGKTGSGKSSLLRTIYCDIPLKMGKIIVDGEGISIKYNVVNTIIESNIKKYIIKLFFI